MSKFHSMVSRRDFMKGLGLVGAGIGAAAATAPVFHDVDEVMTWSTSTAIQKRPWYVRERDFFDTTTEVDWNLMERRDQRESAQAMRTQAIYYGEDRVAAAGKKGKANRNQLMAELAPGWGLKWQAMIEGRTRPGHNLNKGRGGGRYQNWHGIADPKGFSGTPEERGVAKWTGTPEEGSHLLQAAMRYFGSCLTGFGELDQRWRDKIVIKYTSDDDTLEAAGYLSESNWPPPDTLDGCHPVVFENVARSYSTPSKFVISTAKPMYAVVGSGMDSMSVTKCQKYPPFRWSPNSSAAIGHHDVLHYSLVNFLRALGDYECLGLAGHQEAVLPTPSAGVLVGIGESSRQGNLILSPEYAFAHNPGSHITDLPLAPTKPIDAGLFRFCHSCQRCADACPFGVISTEKEPSFDITPTQGKPSIFHVKGPKSFWSDCAGCRLQRNEIGGCGACVAACTFMVEDGASIHKVVKGTIATTGLFNGFLATMSDNFGFGPTEPEDWFDMSHPVFGIDTTAVAQTGYRH